MPRCLRSSIDVARQAEHHVGVLGQRGPDLRAVDDVMVAVADRPGLERGEVGTGARFRKALAPPVVAGQDPRQIAALLFLAAKGDDHWADHVDAKGNHARRAGGGNFAVEQIALDRRPAGAAIFLRPVGGDPAALMQKLLPADLGVLVEGAAGAAPLPDFRRQGLIYKGAHFLDEVPVFLTEGEFHRLLSL